MNPVMEWFGPSFQALDPLLQDLHRHGGKLSGEVDIEFGRGLAGMMGRRLAAKVGLPTVPGAYAFEVSITHVGGALRWSRKFNDCTEMVSLFVPHGVYPQGYWRETTGALALDLGVAIRDGGWYWIQRRISIFGVPLPLAWFPKSQAYKRINQGLYEFSVSFRFSLIGQLVRYSGNLTGKPNAQ